MAKENGKKYGPPYTDENGTFIGNGVDPIEPVGIAGHPQYKELELKYKQLWLINQQTLIMLKELQMHNRNLVLVVEQFNISINEARSNIEKGFENVEEKKENKD